MPRVSLQLSLWEADNKEDSKKEFSEEYQISTIISFLDNLSLTSPFPCPILQTKGMVWVLRHPH
jgi:hypothetical protein